MQTRLTATPLKDNEGYTERALLTCPNGYALAVVDVDALWGQSDSRIADALIAGRAIDVYVEVADDGDRGVIWDVQHAGYLVALAENPQAGDPFMFNYEALYGNGDNTVYNAIKEGPARLVLHGGAK